jgi:soluble lytic murein transglycosylase-like protein
MDEKEARNNVARLVEVKDGPLGAAWTSYYRYKDRAEPGTPKGYALVALKRELKYRGYGDGLDTESLFFGAAAKARTTEFQVDVGLKGDGVIGPTTARRLFKKRIWDAAHTSNVPALMLCKQLNLESGFDPAAVGYVDPRDRGLAQINSYWHPEIDDAKAFDPAFSIPWAANYLGENIKALGDTDAGLAAHNVGRFYARQWLEANKPVSGLYTVEGKDYAAIITKYLQLLKSRDC